MVSILNGLSALGQGISQFAGTAGLALQKSQLENEAAILADQLATTRETKLQSDRQAFTSGENVLNRTATSENLATTQAAEDRRNAATIAGSASNNAATNAAALARTKLEISAPPADAKMIEYINNTFNPDGTRKSEGATPATGAGVQSGVTPTPDTWDGSPPTGATDTGGGAQPSAPPARSMVSDLLDRAKGLPKYGSTEANRYDIAQDVDNDPAFKYATKGQRAAEKELRVAQSYGGLSPDATDMIADRVIKGDTNALSGLGYGNSGAANRAKVQEVIAQKLKDQGLSGADVTANVVSLMGEKAGARTSGTREATVSQAVFEAKAMMPIALAASEKVDRTQFPGLNSVLMSAEKGTGGENVVNLAGATNSFINAYARAVTPVGAPTEGAQNRAREVLDASWAKGQYSSQMRLLTQEMDAALKSPVTTLETQRARITGRPAPSDTAAPTTTAAPAAAPGGWTVKRID